MVAGSALAGYQTLQEDVGAAVGPVPMAVSRGICTWLSEAKGRGKQCSWLLEAADRHWPWHRAFDF